MKEDEDVYFAVVWSIRLMALMQLPRDGANAVTVL